METVTRCFALALFVSLLPAAPLLAQEASGRDADDTLEEIVVTGSRRIIQNSIGIKRDATTITDGLSADDIGDLPALSIGEALETVTSASSHRENGGATEISIRGLGPFLSATVFNSREATNGSGDRSVNFSQFPSELMNKLAISKSQDASLIEGGVAGLIQFETLKPLDYGERRIQINAKGNYNPDQQDIRDAMESSLGYRATLSYVDQFDLGGLGRFGVSLGYQDSDTSQPEAEVRSSSPTGTSRYACINDPRVTDQGFYRNNREDDCEDLRVPPESTSSSDDRNEGYDTTVDPATGLARSAGLDYAFAPSSRGFRQNDTSEEREAFFGAFQWQPSEQWDINFDIQISERVQAERRADLNFANQKRVKIVSGVPVTGPSLITSSQGAILEWVGETAIESNSELYSRTEDYVGGGLSVAWDVNDRLNVSADLSFSKTTREELQISLRMQSDPQDIFNEDIPGVDDYGYPPNVSWKRNSKGVPIYELTNFDVTDHTLFSDEYRVRIDSDVDRENEITAFRSDAEYELEGSWNGIEFKSVQAGLRFSELEYLNLDDARTTSPNLDDSSQGERDAIMAMNELCRTGFPESGFLSSVRSGNLLTNFDTDDLETRLPISGTGNSWATFDTACMVREIIRYHNPVDENGDPMLDEDGEPIVNWGGAAAYRGGGFPYPAQQRIHPNTIDVREDTFAIYAMVNFETEFAGRPVYGNAGVRVVNTDVESVGYRTEYEILTDEDGFLSIQAVPGADLERVSAGDDYTEFLPSVNLVMELSPDLLLRAGLFRNLSRADPSDMGYNRSFSINQDDDITDPNDLISNVSGSGNPGFEPLVSWNYDFAIEWYFDEDTLVAGGLYFKRFTGGFQQSRSAETFVVDGQPVRADFTITETMDETNNLWGFEFTGTHRFSWLPAPFDGLGVKLSYNHAESDFNFEDSNYGTVVIRNDDGSVFSQTQGILAPGNVPGFSRNVFSGQLYYQIGDFDAQLIYKYRSDYFQPYVSNGTRLRFIDDVEVWEIRLSYKPTDYIKVTLEGINLFDEPKTQFFYTDDTVGEINAYGPRLFFGVQLKL